MLYKRRLVPHLTESVQTPPGDAHLSTSVPVWLRPGEAAEHICCSTSSLAKMRLRGDGPPYAKLSRLILYERGAIDQWLRGRMRQSTSEMVGARP